MPGTASVGSTPYWLAIIALLYFGPPGASQLLWGQNLQIVPFHTDATAFHWHQAMSTMTMDSTSTRSAFPSTSSTLDVKNAKFTENLKKWEHIISKFHTASSAACQEGRAAKAIKKHTSKQVLGMTTSPIVLYSYSFISSR